MVPQLYYVPTKHGTKTIKDTYSGNAVMAHFKTNSNKYTPHKLSVCQKSATQLRRLKSWEKNVKNTKGHYI